MPHAVWKDIRRVAELRMAEPHLNATHFLGAVVIQAHEAGGAASVGLAVNLWLATSAVIPSA